MNRFYSPTNGTPYHVPHFLLLNKSTIVVVINTLYPCTWKKKLALHWAPVSMYSISLTIRPHCKPKLTLLVKSTCCGFSFCQRTHYRTRRTPIALITGIIMLVRPWALANRPYHRRVATTFQIIILVHNCSWIDRANEGWRWQQTRAGRPLSPLPPKSTEHTL